MSMFNNPMLAGHSGVRRFPGLSVSTHRRPPVSPILHPRVPRAGGLVRMPAPLPHFPGSVKTKINNFLGTSTKQNMARRYRRKRGNRRRRKYGRRASQLQPKRVIRKLKTVHYGSLDAAAGAIAIKAHAANSHSDPLNGGGQPLGYDQYSTLYSRAAVLGWKVRIELCSTDNTNAVSVGYTNKLGSASLTSFGHYKEIKGTVSTIMTPDIDKTFLSAKGRVKSFFNSKILTDDKLNSAIGSNPTDLIYGHLWVQPMDASADPATVRYIITLEQVVCFFDPIIPARS